MLAAIAAVVLVVGTIGATVSLNHSGQQTAQKADAPFVTEQSITRGPADGVPSGQRSNAGAGTRPM